MIPAISLRRAANARCYNADPSPNTAARANAPLPPNKSAKGFSRRRGLYGLLDAGAHGTGLSGDALCVVVQFSLGRYCAPWRRPGEDFRPGISRRGIAAETQLDPHQWTGSRRRNPANRSFAPADGFLPYADVRA